MQDQDAQRMGWICVRSSSSGRLCRYYYYGEVLLHKTGQNFALSLLPAECLLDPKLES